MAEPEIVHVVAEVVDSMHPSISMSNAMSESAVKLLQTQGYPVGLARELGNSKATYPLRFWIVDNSGSMVTPDDNNLPQEFSIAEHGEASSPGITQAGLNILQQTTPAGVTPLKEHLEVITTRVEEIAPVLRQQSQKAVVVIATDGLPTDSQGHRTDQVRAEFVEALKTLQLQPVWIVIRLCTDNGEVVDFYNKLDAELEIPLDVIDDFLGEAAQVSKVNKWLNYALPLHRCREMGYHNRVSFTSDSVNFLLTRRVWSTLYGKAFDLLDEDKFNHDQLRQFVQLLFGREFPDPTTDWKEFIEQIEEVNEKAGKEWNCKTKKLSPWLDKRELIKKFAPKRGFFGGR